MVEKAEEFVQNFVEKAESIKNETDRSKKYRSGIAVLAQMAVNSNNMTYLEAAIRFTGSIIDGHDRSKAYVDIVRGTAAVAINLSNPKLVCYALELSANTDEGHDRSHAMQAVAAALAEVGTKNNAPAAVEEAKKLVETIEYDTYRSMAWRGIARTKLGIDDTAAGLDYTNKALEIIDSSDSISKAIYRSSAYVDMSKLFLDLEQIETAMNCIRKAEDLANMLENEFERSSIYQSVAETQVRMGARLKDRTFFKMAVESFGHITREYYRTTARQTLKNVLENFNEEDLIETII